MTLPPLPRGFCRICSTYTCQYPLGQGSHWLSKLQGRMPEYRRAFRHSEWARIRRERQGHCVTVAILDKTKKQAQQQMLSFLCRLKMRRCADDTRTKSAYISLTTYYTQNFLQRLQRLGLTTAIHPFPKTTSAALRVSGVEPNSAVLGLASV